MRLFFPNKEISLEYQMLQFATVEKFLVLVKNKIYNKLE